MSGGPVEYRVGIARSCASILSQSELATSVAVKTHKVLRTGNVTRESLHYFMSQWMLCGFLRVLCIFIGTRREQEKKQESAVASDLVSSSNLVTQSLEDRLLAFFAAVCYLRWFYFCNTYAHPTKV